MAKIYFQRKQNFVFDLKELIKQQFTQQDIAKRLKLSTRQLQNILDNQDNISINRLQEILNILGYKLELTITKNN